MLFLLKTVSFSQKELKSVFPEMWKTKIGVSTYRTNTVFHEGKIFVGSNGLDRNFQKDSLDGVYEINAKSGKIIHHYACKFNGDNDVNGVAIGDGKLFFGNDNYYFFCFDIKTKEELWKFRTPFDVESCPQLADLNGDKVLDAAFNVEGFGFYAVNGLNGELLWKNDFIQSHSGNSSPLKYDINDDGVMDFLSSGRGNVNDSINENDPLLFNFKMAHYGDYNFALNGKNGNFLWISPTGAGVHASPFIYQNGKKTEFIFLDCYGEVSVIDKSGKRLKSIGLGYDQYSSPSVTKDKHFVYTNNSIEFEDKFLIYDTTYKTNNINKNATYLTNEVEGKISSSTMIADVLGLGNEQLIGVTESGTVFISKSNGEKIENFSIPKGAEASIFIADIDGDGFLEILIADLNGFLTCYKTKSKGKVTHGIFR